jgi:cell filamentation protein
MSASPETDRFQQVERRASEAWRAYLAPGTDVLANKAGLVDPAQAERFERLMTTRRLTDLPRTPHTPEGFMAIHRHLFQDVYEWAGRPRTVEMHRSDPQADGTTRHDAFLQTRFIEQGLATSFKHLDPLLPRLEVQARMDPRLRDVQAVANVIARHVADLNFVHAFRDGNGRTMRAQADNLAQTAGLRLNEAQLDREAWNRGSAEANRDPLDVKTLRQVIGRALETREQALERQHYVARGERPPHVGHHARDLPGVRQERDYGLGD